MSSATFDFMNAHTDFDQVRCRSCMVRHGRSPLLGWRSSGTDFSLATAALGLKVSNDIEEIRCRDCRKGFEVSDLSGYDVTHLIGRDGKPLPAVYLT